MKDCLILGSGRSGTSLVAGLLKDSGYFLGHHLIPPDIANPKGYFEDIEVNTVNEELLAAVVPRRPRGIIGNLFYKARPAYSQRWLAKLPYNVKFSPSKKNIKRIKSLVAQSPFCFKDPRFSYTFPVWEPYLPKHTVIICVFRTPSNTALSLQKEAARDSILRNLKLKFTLRDAFEVWQQMYEHILRHYSNSRHRWLFLNYSQVLNGEAFCRIIDVLGVPHLPSDFADTRLNRCYSDVIEPWAVKTLYQKLCDLSYSFCV